MWKLIGTWALKGATWALANHPDVIVDLLKKTRAGQK
jgi:hypothetical protein